MIRLLFDAIVRVRAWVKQNMYDAQDRYRNSGYLDKSVRHVR